MNKRLPILILSSALILLAGCGSSSPANKKGDIICEAVLKQNTEPTNKELFSAPEMTLADLGSLDIKSVEYKSGFLIVKTKDGKTGVYSTIKDMYVCGPKEIINVSPSDVSNSVVGGLVRVQEDEHVYKVFDGIGNEIETSTKPYTSVKDGYDSKTKQYYVELISNGVTNKYVYDSNGTPTPYTSNNQQGSPYLNDNYINLSSYGHKNYRAFTSNSRIIVFDDRGIEVSSISMPSYDTFFIAGNYFVFQISTLLDFNNDNYDYITGDDRFALETCRYNYLTGEREDLNDVSFVIRKNEEIVNFADSNGVHKYVYAAINKISDKRLLSSAKENYLIDDSMELHDNVTGIPVDDFVRIDNNYYNKTSKTIYDSNLNEIVLLGDSNPIFVENGQIVVCRHDGHYGAVNGQGKIVVPFEFKDILISHVTDKYFIGQKGDSYEVFQFDTTNCTYNSVLSLEGYKQVNYIGGGLYSLDKGANDGKVLDTLILSSLTIKNFQTIEESTCSFGVNSAKAINAASIYSLELKENVYTVNIGKINIIH